MDNVASNLKSCFYDKSLMITRAFFLSRSNLCIYFIIHVPLIVDAHVILQLDVSFISWFPLKLHFVGQVFYILMQLSFSVSDSFSNS